MTDTAVAPPEVPTDTENLVDTPPTDEQETPPAPKLTPDDVLVGNPAVPDLDAPTSRERLLTRSNT